MAADREKDLSPEIRKALGHTDLRFPPLLEKVDQQIRTTFSTSTEELSKLADEWRRLDRESAAIYPAEEDLPQTSSPREAVSVGSNLHGRYPQRTDVLRIFNTDLQKFVRTASKL